MSRFSSRVRLPRWSTSRIFLRVPTFAIVCGLSLALLVSLASLQKIDLSSGQSGRGSPASKPTPQPLHNEPALYSWDSQEPMNPLHAANMSAPENLSLTWEKIDFGTNLEAMTTVYQGALNPPVWHRTNWTHAIFYHVFIPDNEATPVALNLIKEQVGQIAYAAPSNVVTPVYYSLVGPTAAQYQTQVEQFFERYPSLSLHLLQNLEAGNEEVTLNYVRDYCVQQTVLDRTKTRVTYLHNKGSFHPEDYNHHWRRALTAGALHPDCLQPLESSTNACGLQFFTRFTVFFPGNMWTGRCDFLSQLQPLVEHAPQTIKVLETGMLMRLRRQVITNHFGDPPTDWFGVDRYINEHWLGTHPDLVPTDVDPGCRLWHVQYGQHRYTELRGTTGLRCRGMIAGIPDHTDSVLAFLSEHTGERLRDYFSFPEMIIRWFTFYGRGPADTSPIWTWYSDGDVWKEAVRKHGISAVSIVTDKYGLEEIGRTSRTAFSNRTTNGRARLPKGLQVSKEERTIFFHVVLPLAVDPLYQTAIAALSNQLQLAAKALQAESQTKSSIYYTLAARNVTNELGVKDAVQITCKAHALECIPLGDTVVHPDFAGETLWYVHQYCSVNPTTAVTYLSNVIPDQGGSSTTTFEQEQFILDTTRGALNKDCWRSSSTTCSTCGLTFSTIGMFHYKGNMFSARCDYINKLIPPVQFEPKMNQLAGMAMAAHTRDRIALGPYDVTPSFFGIDHHATEHWIGSHPSIVPCDLAGDGNTTTLTEWSTHTDVGKDYQGLDTSMPDHQRLRWYSLLPGNLMKWDYLYDTIPANDSWVWREFPDGQHWKNTVQSQRLRLNTL